MSDSYSSTKPLLDLPLWEKAKSSHTLLSFTLEITARCNNDCPHCYINEPENDVLAEQKELTFEQIKKIVDDAVALGALWCLVSGGEPLLRKDFFDIYLYLKQKGLLVSVFTNATLITEEHIQFFKKYPPRDIEVTVYGITRGTYAHVTQRPKNFDKCMAGIRKLSEARLALTLKSAITRSNYKELNKIASFAENISQKPFRFDPFLHLRNDRDALKNREILSLRLSTDEIIAIESADDKRLLSLKKKCNLVYTSHSRTKHLDKLFKCGAGLSECCISYDGFFKLCTTLCHRNFVFDLKNNSITKAWETFVPEVRAARSKNKDFIETCGKCKLTDFCMSCPAHNDLEINEPDGLVEYFCIMAKKRYETFSKNIL